MREKKRGNHMYVHKYIYYTYVHIYIYMIYIYNIHIYMGGKKRGNLALVTVAIQPP